MSQTLSSAVTIPEDSIERPPSANGLKRKHSEASEQDEKRQRISSGKNSPSATEEPVNAQHEDDKDTTTDTESHTKPAAIENPPPKTEPRKRRGGPDEKQRSKRLFGALLGNLNQPSDRTTKRRAEIEQRRKAELQKQDDERIEDRQRRLERLAIQRKKEQIRVDEENMHIRHRNLLDAANYFQTQAEPRLYYRPWDLLPDEEDRIDEQVKEAQERIDKELAEFKEEKQKRLEALGRSDDDKVTHEAPKDDNVATQNGAEKPAAADEKEVQSGSTNQKISSGSPGPEKSPKPNEIPESSSGAQVESDKPEEETQPNDIEKPNEGKSKEEEEKAEAEEDGDHVVEGDEDTVVY